MLKVKTLSKNATEPKRATENAAGYDLSSAKNLIVPAGGTALVQTDIKMAIPKGSYGRVIPLINLFLNFSISIGGGVIDSDYRGNVGVIFTNNSKNDFKINVGDKIAYIIFQKIETPPVVVVDVLDRTERNDGGFGSTGI
ncbi:hypothetical protein DICPUDRAFT_56203 [Dictyostelium purpureum]|uniref:Deoxyuridine 5'-triphosphate nucleotidohydrolase n=1 Tax=Dictyostelium purpureum TaxID=5786 RepID=F0ZQA7_DICPU|nr:uncharacterized protein DICPUDRAFT_56203 [Dictyostelium purpureum]EGC33857.1 hypothetical protein DICPUDRAFT_56203 [Dictyostelium purpureum]|eukprot:XP_003289595.1 hypothetical protein DICPUDRAFT_56203 [Dictyostelium purpureum]